MILSERWPAARFTRTIVTQRKDKKPVKYKRLDFYKATPTEVTENEQCELLQDIGNALFEVRRDESGRLRKVDPWSNQQAEPVTQAAGA